MKLKAGTRVVVTGGGSGLGRELCLAFGKRKHHILISDLHLDSAERTAQEALRAGAASVAAICCDVSKFSQVEALGTAAIEKFGGGVDLLVNNAGVAAGGNFEDLSIKDWHWLIETNLWGVVYGCNVFLPGMKKLRKGHILNIASAAGLLNPPRMASYNVAKAGVVALSETLYGELIDTGVGITVACPTFFKTGLLDSARFANEDTKVFAGRLFNRSSCTAEAVASACLRAIEKNKLHLLPNLDGKVAWTAKRISPRRFMRTMVRLASMV